ncbi:ABC transporter substrate-binding protein [Bradyrhizobium zhanjiangense]|uniref:Spermidine/putrescine ABC transporter substrate-binding protein n=1 Tax=Bradyrhizobium zhanjiangense TaxID=1325107 RepID=A0A4Q0SP97_9BRAD|nr:ABC transporter substrate-binding protein [Bradyrhizobium zhanjiangense]RXH40418.1 spermidine/putrescine ABC transporter substrate-binding protein [Bradyrhizobium zhanjiangense]
MRAYSSIVGAVVATGLAVNALVPATPALAGDHLTIVSWGGALQLGQRKAWFEPFSKATGIKIIEDEYNGEAAKIRAMVQSKTVSWDVVDGYSVWVNQLCADGILERIDWKRLGLDRTKFVDGERYECGVPSVISATVVAYDKDRLPSGPKSIADLFDTQKFPGKRGLWKNPQDNLEWALIADGVTIKDVYKVLGTSDGVERAFKKLDTIKKDVIWWTSGAQPAQFLADGQVVMTSAWNGRISDAVKNSGKHFQIMWDAAKWGTGNIWVIPKGSPRLDDAYKFIAFVASPQVQGKLTEYITYPPANNDATAFLDPAVLPDLVTAPGHVGNSLHSDADFWTDKGDELKQRFTAWLAK